MDITEERKKNIDFTAPYMENHQIIVVAASSPIKTKADLAGKVVGAQEGSSAVDAIKKEEAVFKSLKEFKTFGDNVTALMDLSAGRLEAVVVDEVVGRYYVAKKPAAKKPAAKAPSANPGVAASSSRIRVALSRPRGGTLTESGSRMGAEVVNGVRTGPWRAQGTMDAQGRDNCPAGITILSQAFKQLAAALIFPA